MKYKYIFLPLIFLGSCNDNSLNHNIVSLAYDNSKRDTLVAIDLMKKIKATKCENAQILIDASWCSKKFGLYHDMIDISYKIQSTDINTQETKILLLWEGYRGLQSLDSALHYAQELVKFDSDTSNYIFNKVQITFEMNYWLKSLDFAYEGLGIIESKTKIDSMLFKEYIVHNLCRLNRFEDACAYAQIELPKYYETMQDSICNSVIRASWIESKNFKD
jgi:hypothetical protein